MFMHPTTFLWLNEIDRERTMTQRVLERAARVGKPEDGTARGGISLVHVFGKARDAVTNLSVAGPRSASPLIGLSGA